MLIAGLTVIGYRLWLPSPPPDGQADALTDAELARLVTLPDPSEAGGPVALATAEALMSCCATGDADRRALVEAAMLARQPAAVPAAPLQPWERLAWRVRAWLPAKGVFEVEEAPVAADVNPSAESPAAQPTD